MKGFTPDNTEQLPEVVINAQPFGINPVEFEKVTGALNDIQLESIGAILKEAHVQGVRIKTQLAYIYATAFHESRITPIKEWGSETYLKNKKYYPFFGRGYVQLTWDYNYKKEGERLGIDLLKNPDLALEVDIAANIIVHGMIKGSFTGKKLSDYLTANKTDFPNARKIINSMDKAAKIAEYASGFMKAIV